MALSALHVVILAIVFHGLIFWTVNINAAVQTWTCDYGWSPFTRNGEIFCVRYRTAEHSFAKAHNECLSINASLVSIHSKEKNIFMTNLLKTHKINGAWIGLKYTPNRGYQWLRKNGTEKFDYSPDELDLSAPESGTLESSCAKIVTYTTAWQMGDCFRRYSTVDYFCEKKSKCRPGAFGYRCEKVCHCHGQPCNPEDNTGSCRFGCRKGWTGDACDKRKEKAAVTYFCVNSPDQGTYVSIMIDTKGITYRNLHGLNSDGVPAPWSNDTIIKIGIPKGFVNIKILMTEATKDSMKSGTCAGKSVGKTTYQWPIVIQERKRISMDVDQALLVTCDFSQAETLSRKGNSGIEGHNKTPLVKINETHEDISLEVADAFNGKPLEGASMGSPVRLRIRYGFSKGSLVKGVVPHNCKASSGDGKKTQPLLDKFGCPESDLVSSFKKTNESHCIQTDWFPFFGFEGSSDVLLECSFTLCFVGCEASCVHVKKNDTMHRARRSVEKNYQNSIVRRIEILPGSAKEHKRRVKPESTSPKAEEKEKEWFNQWINPLSFFLLAILMIAIVLIIFLSFSRSIHSSIDDIRCEMQTARTQR